MPIRAVQFIPDCYYHIFNRGVNRQPIFLSPDNWSFFLRRLRVYFQDGIAEIIAYCLMPTHYHLLVLVKSEFFSENVMQPFGVSYTKAINKQYDRVGPLFQGPFRAMQIASVDYLLQLARYIHLNPVAAGLVEKPEDWSFSSYRDTIGLRNGTLARPQIIIEQFGTADNYRRFVEEGRESKIDSIADLILE